MGGEGPLGGAGWDLPTGSFLPRPGLQGALGAVGPEGRESPFPPLWPRSPNCPGFGSPRLGPFPWGLKSLQKPQGVCVCGGGVPSCEHLASALGRLPWMFSEKPADPASWG